MPLSNAFIAVLLHDNESCDLLMRTLMAIGFIKDVKSITESFTCCPRSPYLYFTPNSCVHRFSFTPPLCVVYSSPPTTQKGPTRFWSWIGTIQLYHSLDAILLWKFVLQFIGFYGIHFQCYFSVCGKVVVSITTFNYGEHPPVETIMASKYRWTRTVCEHL